jgi:pimeloyl-ACP methyl ester carboxylesterase
MGVAENKALVRQFYEEVWNRGNFEFASEVFADDYLSDIRAPTRIDYGLTDVLAPPQHGEWLAQSRRSPTVGSGRGRRRRSPRRREGTPH